MAASGAALVPPASGGPNSSPLDLFPQVFSIICVYPKELIGVLRYLLTLWFTLPREQLPLLALVILGRLNFLETMIRLLFQLLFVSCISSLQSYFF